MWTQPGAINQGRAPKRRRVAKRMVFVLRGRPLGHPGRRVVCPFLLIRLKRPDLHKCADEAAFSRGSRSNKL